MSINIQNIETSDLQVPEFSQEDRDKMFSELSFTRWKEIGKKIDINGEWYMEITKEERDGFYYGEVSKQYIVDFFVKTGHVYIYHGNDDSHEGTGFQLKSRKNNGREYYDMIQESIELSLKNCRNSISEQINTVKVSIDILLDQVKGLTAIEEGLNKKLKDIQKYQWSIPGEILSGTSIEDIVGKIDAINNK